MKMKKLCVLTLALMFVGSGYAQEKVEDSATTATTEATAPAATQAPEKTASTQAPPQPKRVSPRVCKQTARKVERHVRKCLRSKDFAKRQACVNSVDKLAPSHVFEGCQPQLKNVRRKMTAYERRLHKGQKLAMLDGRGNDRRRNRARRPNPRNRISPRVCKAAGKRVENHVRRCLRSKDFARRKACVNSVDDLAPRHVFEGCRGVFNPLKAKLTAYERKLHPGRRLAMVDEAGAKNPYRKEMRKRGGKRISRRMCANVARGARHRANSCLKRKRFNRRKRCFQGVSRYIDRRVGEKCNYIMDPMGQEYVAKEKQRYQGQSALAAIMGKHHDHLGGDHVKADKQGHSVAQCERVSKMAMKRGMTCMRRRRFKNRKRCIDNLKRSIKRRVGEGCQEHLDVVGPQLAKVEKQRYPNQPNTVHGPDHQKADPMPKVVEAKPRHERLCQSVTKRVERMGNSCLSRKRFKVRKRCFDRIGKFIDRRAGDKCEYMLDPVGERFVQAEKSRYNGQSALAALMNNDSHAGHINKDHHSVDKSGHSVAQCKRVARMAEKRANRCLSKKNRRIRKRCMDAVGKSIDRRVGRGCDAIMDPLGDKIAMREKQLYPNQQPTLGDGSQGPAKGGPKRMTPAEAAAYQRKMVAKASGPQRQKICAFATKTISRRADSCIRRVRRSQRAACHANIGRYIDHKGWGEVCSGELASIKDQYRQKEQQRYPSQEGTIE